MGELGRSLLVLGALLLLAGAALLLFGRLALPGDLTVRRPGFTLYAPFGTMIVLSIVLTILLNLFLRVGK